MLFADLRIPSRYPHLSLWLVNHHYHHCPRLGESSRSIGGEQLLAGSLGNTVRERESEFFGEELFHVWAFDVDRLLDFDNFQDLIQSARMANFDRI